MAAGIQFVAQDRHCLVVATDVVRRFKTGHPAPLDRQVGGVEHVNEVLGSCHPDVIAVDENRELMILVRSQLREAVQPGDYRRVCVGDRGEPVGCCGVVDRVEETHQAAPPRTWGSQLVSGAPVVGDSRATL